VTRVLEFAEAKKAQKRISIVTAYDACAARLIATSSVDAILIGDSVAMVVHGHPTTLTATVELMSIHTRAVAVGAGERKFLIADLPFLSYRKGVGAALDAAGALMASGAHAVKLEGVGGHEDVIRQMVGSGIPVMGHIGLTPQSVHQLGGFRVQGRTAAESEALEAQARQLEALGCFAVVLECVPEHLGAQITRSLSIPTIGIGAGAGTDGQVLVLHDLLGLTERRPRFARSFVDGSGLFLSALNTFDAAVKTSEYPLESESYR